ncbi:MAG: hypothetical protein PHY47_12750 [Lachnospiraceae bacterium]|nr:hypothetical protein [Lachnospiraceae bacterium]
MNNDLKSIASEFYKTTNKRPTKATFGVTMKQAQSLIEAGFSKQEIIDGIHYCAAHPPKKGFMSLGWLSYVLEDTLIKIKAEQTLNEIRESNHYKIEQEVGVDGNKRKFERSNDIESRFGEGFNFELFK